MLVVLVHKCSEWDKWEEDKRAVKAEESERFAIEDRSEEGGRGALISIHSSSA